MAMLIAPLYASKYAVFPAFYVPSPAGVVRMNATISS